MGISIHALLAESDRGAYIMKMIAHHFYPRSPCGERLTLIQKIAHLCLISIHALLAESDCGCCARCHCWGLFLSTLSLRRATVSNVATGIPFSISIHALLAESDRFFACSNITPLIFLSTLSLRRATLYCAIALGDITFLSTLSLRRATILSTILQMIWSHFYPRSPCGERRHRADFPPHKIHFYPRSPCGERLNDAINGCNPDIISIHALLAESDLESSLYRGRNNRISIHALLAESDCPSMTVLHCNTLFLSTLSLRRATHSL